MAQLMPLPPTVSCFSTIQIGFTFLVLAHLGSPGQRAVKRVCVCHGVVESDAVDVDDRVLCADAAAEPEVQAETDAEQHTEPTRIDEVDD